jgi:hypothetical protein
MRCVEAVDMVRGLLFAFALPFSLHFCACNLGGVSLGLGTGGKSGPGLLTWGVEVATGMTIVEAEVGGACTTA